MQTVARKALNTFLSALSGEQGMSRPQIFFFTKNIFPVRGEKKTQTNTSPLFLSEGLLTDGKEKEQNLQEECWGRKVGPKTE